MAVLVLCLAVLCLAASADAAARLQDAPLRATDTLLGWEGNIGVASVSQDCEIVVERFRLAGDVQVLFVPEGADVDQEVHIDRIGQRLEYDLTYDVASSSQTLVASLPGCTQKPPVQRVVVWCESCQVGSRGLQGTLAASTPPSQQQQQQQPGGTVVIVLREASVLPSLPQATTRVTRSLLAACSPLSVGGTAYSFDACQDLSANANTPYEIFYSLEASGSGTAFKGGLRVNPNGGWAAFAFPTSGGMIGANAVVVTAAQGAAAAEVAGYKLTSYDAPAINAAKGSFPLTETAVAEEAGGTLVAVFTAQLPQPPSELAAAPLRVLYATGALSPVGKLVSHEVSGVSGRAALTVAAMAPATQASPTPTSPVPAAPKPTLPAPEKPPAGDSEKGEAEGAKDPEGEADAEDTADDATTTPAVDPTAAASQSSTTSDTGSGCAVTISNEVNTYSSCFLVKGIGSNFHVAWNLEADPADASSSLLSMAMNATSNGYVSVGFPTEPGAMIDAGALILQACATCPSGASLAQYWMTAESLSGVKKDPRLGATNLVASSSGGVLAGSFKLQLTGTPARRRRSLLAMDAAQFPLLYAAGRITASGGLLQHSQFGSSEVDLTGAVAPPEGVGAEGDTAKVAHMWLMAVGWGVIIPLGIVGARSFKPQLKNGLWFKIHRAVQSLGFLLVCVGLGLGFKANGGWETDKPVHRDLGISATALALVQMVSLVARPAPDAKYRSVWFQWHAWVGRSAAVLAIANIYYGIIKVEELGTWAWALYTAVLSSIVIVAVIKDVHDYMHVRRYGPTSPVDGAAAKDSFLAATTLSDEAAHGNIQLTNSPAPQGLA